MDFILKCGSTTVKDIDDNEYNIVLIGEQCWMKENLRTTRYADGAAIDPGASTSTTTAFRYAPNGDTSNVATYGYLYNWAAVMKGASSSATPSGVQGICPEGWHVPSDAEWDTLTNYVGSQTDYQCNSSSAHIAKALASKTGWSTSSTTCAVGNVPGDNDKTGFSVLPAGYYRGAFNHFGNGAHLWSATESSSSSAYSRYLDYNDAGVSRINRGKNYVFSVRCLRD